MHDPIDPQRRLGEGRRRIEGVAHTLYRTARPQHRHEPHCSRTRLRVLEAPAPQGVPFAITETSNECLTTSTPTPTPTPVSKPTPTPTPKPATTITPTPVLVAATSLSPITIECKHDSASSELSTQPLTVAIEPEWRGPSGPADAGGSGLQQEFGAVWDVCRAGDKMRFAGNAFCSIERTESGVFLRFVFRPGEVNENWDNKFVLQKELLRTVRPWFGADLGAVFYPWRAKKLRFHHDTTGFDLRRNRH